MSQNNSLEWEQRWWLNRNDEEKKICPCIVIMTVDTYNSALIGSTCHALTQTLWGKCRDGNGSARNGVGTWDVDIVTRESADGDNGSGNEGAGVSWMGDMLFVTEHHCKSLTHCWWHDSTEELSLDWLCGNPRSNLEPVYCTSSITQTLTYVILGLLS